MQSNLVVFHRIQKQKMENLQEKNKFTEEKASSQDIFTIAVKKDLIVQKANCGKRFFGTVLLQLSDSEGDYNETWISFTDFIIDHGMSRHYFFLSRTKLHC